LEEDVRELEILEPASVGDAVRLLAELGDEAKVLAGGTAVVLMLNQGLISPRYLVSLARIPDLIYIRHEPGTGLRLGALTTHRAVELAPVVRQRAPMLAAVFHEVANVRVRNQATVGGVLAEADYASDPPCMLAALDAQVTVAGPDGERTLPVDGFIQGFYHTRLSPGELITAVNVPELAGNTRGVYLKFVSRSSEDRPCVGVAAVVRWRGDVCESLRIVVGAVAGAPQRVPEAERLAAGNRLSPELVRAIAAQYAEQIEPLSDIRGSAWYRKEIIHVLVRRAIEQAGGLA
jgi:carbon-monoxide dehydrogenase medium subunit